MLKWRAAISIRCQSNNLFYYRAGAFSPAPALAPGTRGEPFTTSSTSTALLFLRLDRITQQIVVNTNNNRIPPPAITGIHSFLLKTFLGRHEPQHPIFASPFDFAQRKPGIETLASFGHGSVCNNHAQLSDRECNKPTKLNHKIHEWHYVRS